MADIELVIKIPEEDFEIMKHNVAVDNPLCPLGEKEMVTIIANGTPLPAGHGKLYDEDIVKKEAIRQQWTNVMYDTLDHMLSYMKPIIDADKNKKER